MRRLFPLNFVLTPASDTNAALAMAACRAGAVGLFNAELGAKKAQVEAALEELATKGYGEFGIKLGAGHEELLKSLPEWRERGLTWLVLEAEGAGKKLRRRPLQAFRKAGGRVLLELRRWQPEYRELEPGCDGWWAKGHEAGGLVGEECGFVLLQRVLEQADLPVWLRGGYGVHTAAACTLAGAAGGVLDSQLLLLDESPLAEIMAGLLRNLSGTEATLIGDEEQGDYLRLLDRPALRAVHTLKDELNRGEQAADAAALLVRLGRDIDWRQPQAGLLPLGQDAAFAAPYAKKYRRLSRLLGAIESAVDEYPLIADSEQALGENGPMAELLGTRYPIIQGAMTRVSDVPEFAATVADNGALPMTALAMLRGSQALPLLEKTAAQLGGRSWGVGILGFVERELREEQLEAIHRVKPPFAYIAGGRPDQAAALEAEGITTFLHAPTPALLSLFLEQGARRFIFEGRECGGHIGPLSSFALWEQVVTALLQFADSGGDLNQVSIFFAGGIHDARSAAAVAALAAPLSARGARIGVLMGTAYLFTREAVESGAILEGFQQVAIDCDETASVTTGAGHASRCARTPFVGGFHETKRRLLRESDDSKAVGGELDALTLGRLRVATKGQLRDEKGLREADGAEQFDQGMYMIGQLAALHHDATTMAELHRAVSDEALAFLHQALPEVEGVEAESRPADIAIVGIGTLLPKAADARQYWQNIINGLDCIIEIPAERWDWKLYFDADRTTPDKIYSKWGGFLDDVPFDPTRYGMPPLSLRSVDPLQLLTLETVRQALEDAALDDRELPRERTSVILGASGGMGEIGLQYGTRSDLPRVTGPVSESTLERLPEWTEDSFAGLLLNVTAGRAANRFDFGGLNSTVDAACASSLAAVYQGVSELLLGKSDVVVAGGVDTMQSPFAYTCFAKTQALSPRGRCRTFDEEADGIVISEGLAAVVLKRLADAERDGDHIYAVIKGVGGSSDGRAKGLTAPHPEGQIRALNRAYAEAGYSPATLGLVEAHGTGTVAGDRAEMETISRLMASANAPAGGCAVGSVKTMIGHTKAAAGVSGLIKAALALQHRVLPPHIGLKRPQAMLRDADSPLFTTPEAQPWVGHPDYPRRAGVSAFGFGGTNYHVALEEYRDDFQPWRKSALLDDWSVELLLWRAGDTEGLMAQLRALLDALEQGGRPRLAELAYTLQSQPGEGEVQLALVSDSLESLRGQLGGVLAHFNDDTQTLPEGAYYSAAPLLGQSEQGRGQLALLFPGQGSQYPGMLAELTTLFPELLDSLERADAVLKEPMAAGSGKRLSALIHPPKRFEPKLEQQSKAALTRTEVAQPALGAVSAGLWALLSKLGIEPAMAAGHSYGEFVALHAAGALELDDLLRLSEARGRFIVEEAAGKDLGTMLAVKAEWSAVEAVVKNIEGVVLANHNSPVQAVLSGERESIERAQQALTEAGLGSTPLPVAAAFHSPLVEPAQRRLGEFIADTTFSAPRFPVYNNASAAAHDGEPAAIQSAMTEHLVSPVHFVDEVEAMYAAGARLFLEVGPRPVLSRLCGRILGDRPHQAVAVDDNGGGIKGLLHALARLFAEGAQLDTRHLYRGRRLQPLNMKRLAEAGHAPAPGQHVWLVNGTHARRQDEVGATGKRPGLRAGEVADAFANAIEGQWLGSDSEFPQEMTVMTDKRNNGVPLPPGASAPGDQVMAAYQDTMRQFLALQDRVMNNYFGSLNGEAPAPGAYTPPPAAYTPPPAPATPAVTPQAAPQQAAEAAPAPQVAPQAAPAAAPVALDVKSALLGVASERTGYPEDMLDLNQAIEADLGIDSIKRVEILGAFQKALPEQAAQVLQANMEQVTGLGTFQEIIDWVEEQLAGADSTATAGPQSTTEGEAKAPFDSTGTGPNGAPLPRYVMRAHPESLQGVKLSAPPAGLYLCTDGGAVTERLAARLADAGSTLVTIPEALFDDAEGYVDWLAERRAEAPIRGLLHLLPLATAPFDPAMGLGLWQERIEREVKSLFKLLRPLHADLIEDGRLLCASLMGGMFGRDYNGEGFAFPGGAGLSGLVKSVSFEWNADIYSPNFSAKAVDLDPAQDDEACAGQLYQELALFQGRREVGYPRGERTVFRTEPHSLFPRDNELERPNENWVVLATGGARGVTAECLRGFMPYQPTIVMLGRSPMPSEEDGASVGIEGRAELRRFFVEQAKASGESLRPAEVERKITRLLGEREMRSNLADLKAAGVKIDYRVVDVRDETAFGGLIDELYETYGRIDAVLHGAGVIEDKLLVDKPQEAVDRVIGTKLDAAWIMAEKLRPESLKFFSLFTSVAGRYGNPGQSDYATANETLNRLAWILRAHWGGKVKVASFNWNPWGPTTHGAGMVTPEVRAQFEARGVMLIDAEAGMRILLNELLYGPLDEVEIVAGDCPWEYDEARHGALPKPPEAAVVKGGPLALLDGATAEGLNLSKRIDLISDPYLDHHRIDGVPVQPFAGACEYLAETASLMADGRKVIAIEGMQLMNGLRLAGESLSLSVRLQPSEQGFSGELHQDESGKPSYRGRVLLADQLPQAVPYQWPTDLAAAPLSSDAAYRRWLFHGPMFQTITELLGVDERGLLARLRPTRPSELYPPGKEAEWIFDPALVDGAIQTVLIWSRAVRNSTPLPTRLGRLLRFGEEPLPERLISHLKLLSDPADPAIHCHIAICDEQGRLRIMLEDFEGAGSAAMNRVGGGWAYGEPTA